MHVHAWIPVIVRLDHDDGEFEFINYMRCYCGMLRLLW
jgi:hypothetical protein